MTSELPEFKRISLDKLIPYVNNSRTHSDEQITKLASAIREFGFKGAITIDKDYNVLAGHGRIEAVKKLGWDSIPCIIYDDLTPAQKKAFIISDNQQALNAGWDTDLLKLEIEHLQEVNFDVDLLGFDTDFLNDVFDNDTELNDYADGVSGSMVENFGQPPFSVLDTRKGDWLERKRMWRGLIGDNGESRDAVLDDLKSLGDDLPTASLLDPVMAELVVKWFGMENGVAFDPFAGDSVFGFVAGSCGMAFNGIELRKEQADLNQSRCDKVGLPCKYYNDTSENMDKYIQDETIDLVFSCPPYADLEVYSDDPNDLSNMSHSDFFQAYKRILQNTFSKLKDNRFAVVVMGEVRNKNGEYIGTIPKTIEIMEGAGYKFYNEIILINSAGTLPLRAGKYMKATRKVGKMHQNILVFLKGDASKAVADLGDIQAPLEFEVDDE